VLHRHLAVAVLAPPPGGRRIYTIVSHFASQPDADGWLSDPARARLVAEAVLHASGDLQTPYVSGLEGWLAQSGSRVLVPPARWRTAVISAIGLLPLLEAVSYLLAPGWLGFRFGFGRWVGVGGCQATRRQESPKSAITFSSPPRAWM
jgi:uncharacterized protein